MRTGPTLRSVLLGMTLLCGFAALFAAKGMATPTPPTPQAATLTVTLAGNGGGTVSGSGIACPGTCTHVYTTGTSVTLTAAPASGSSFAGWSGDCVGSSPVCVLQMNGTKQVSADFTTGPPGTGNPPPSANAPTCTAHLGSRKVLLKALRHHAAATRSRLGAVTIRVVCDQAATGKLVVKLKGHVPARHGPAKKKAFTLIRAVTLKAHQTRTITLKLPAGILKGLKDKLGESLSGTLLMTNANGTATAKLKAARLTGTSTVMLMIARLARVR